MLTPSPLNKDFLQFCLSNFTTLAFTLYKIQLQELKLIRITHQSPQSSDAVSYSRTRRIWLLYASDISWCICALSLQLCVISTPAHLPIGPFLRSEFKPYFSDLFGCDIVHWTCPPALFCGCVKTLFAIFHFIAPAFQVAVLLFFIACETVFANALTVSPNAFSALNLLCLWTHLSFLSLSFGFLLCVYILPYTRFLVNRFFKIIVYLIYFVLVFWQISVQVAQTTALYCHLCFDKNSSIL